MARSVLEQDAYLRTFIVIARKVTSVTQSDSSTLGARPNMKVLTLSICISSLSHQGIATVLAYLIECMFIFALLFKKALARFKDPHTIAYLKKGKEVRLAELRCSLKNCIVVRLRSMRK